MKRLVGLGVALLACVAVSTASGGSPTAQELQQQFVLAAGPTLKIQVDKAGWYRVGFADLKKGGFVVPKNTASLQLYAEGKQVRIRVTSSGIEFYGVPLDTNSTDRETYWLTNGRKAGARVSTVSSGSPTGRVVTNVAANVVTAPRLGYFAAVLNGEATNIFGGTVQSAAPAKLTVRAPHAASGAAATLTVTLQGYSTLPHRVRVTLNGTQVGTISFSGQVRNTASLSVPAGLLKDGDNAVELQATGGELDFSLLDSIAVTYSRALLADANVLDFNLPAGQRARVDGFTQARIRVLDVTDTTAPAFLRVAISRSSSGYRATIGASRKPRHLFVYVDGTAVKPVALVKNAPSNWNSGQQAADMVIISHADFLSALPPLVSARKAQGLKVAVVNVDDVYDEFGFGAHGPAAIKSFLSWTRQHWAQAPRYVLLVGDATFDPRQETGVKEPDFVPTQFVDTAYLEVPSDDALADFNSDGVPEMAVGRLPVQTLDQAKAVVAKIVRYDTGAAPSRQMLLVSDRFQDYDFEAASRSLYGLLPNTWTTSAVNRAQGPTDAAVHARVLDALNQGPTVVNFFGHGSVKIWTSGSILTAADAAQLRNNHLSLYVMMTCLNGYFVDSTFTSLGEALLYNPSGGAVAVWSSTGETVPTDQILMDQKALGLLLSKPETSLGDAMLQAKASVSDPDVRRTWVLFGDPTTRLH